MDTYELSIYCLYWILLTIRMCHMTHSPNITAVIPLSSCALVYWVSSGSVAWLPSTSVWPGKFKLVWSFVVVYAIIQWGYTYHYTMHYILWYNGSLDFWFGVETWNQLNWNQLKLVIYACYHTEWFTEQLVCASLEILLFSKSFSAVRRCISIQLILSWRALV